MPPSGTIADQDRVLTFLHMLDDDVAEHALRAMDPSVATKLRELLSDFASRPLSSKKQHHVLDEFDRFFRFAVKYAEPNLKLHEPDPADTGNVAEYVLTGDSMHDLEHMNVFQVTSALDVESPRTTAILMKELSTDRNAEILGLMNQELRAAVVLELSLNPKAPPILVQRIARTTVERAATLPVERAEEPDPVERIAEVLRATEKDKRRQMLKSLQEQDAEMSGRIQRLLYRFEDIVDLDDRQIRSVLGRVQTSSISTALFGCDDIIKEKIMGNLSKRARMTLEEEISFLSHVPEAQLTQARDAVGEAIAEIELEGD